MEQGHIPSCGALLCRGGQEMSPGSGFFLYSREGIKGTHCTPGMFNPLAIPSEVGPSAAQ